MLLLFIYCSGLTGGTLAKFDEAFYKTIGLEGTYSNDKLDPGGETKFGITKATASANNFTGDLKLLTLNDAMTIYKNEYWDKSRLSECDNQDVANELFDTSVNCGIETAVIICQKTLNLMNQNGTLWPDIPVDGHIGLVTMGCINRCSFNKANLLIKVLNALQVAHYADLAEKNPKLERFFNGWCDKRG